MIFFTAHSGKSRRSFVFLDTFLKGAWCWTSSDEYSTLGIFHMVAPMILFIKSSCCFSNIGEKIVSLIPVNSSVESSRTWRSNFNNDGEMADMHSSKAADDSIRPLTCQSALISTDRCTLLHDFVYLFQWKNQLGHTLWIVWIVCIVAFRVHTCLLCVTVLLCRLGRPVRSLVVSVSTPNPTSTARDDWCEAIASRQPRASFIIKKDTEQKWTSIIDHYITWSLRTVVKSSFLFYAEVQTTRDFVWYYHLNT